MWYCSKRESLGRNPPCGLVAGRWYEGVREPFVEFRKSVVPVRVDSKEVPVPLEFLIRRKTRADYSFLYFDPRSESEQIQAIWHTPVCPEGHRGSPYDGSAPESHHCSECGTAYPVRREDTGLVIDA